MTRHTDAYRHTSLYTQLVEQAIKEGRLPKNHTPGDVSAMFDALRAEGSLEGDVVQLIGDDLSHDDLENLWAVFTGCDTPDADSAMPSWWADKPHQIAYRMLLRLTRAEDERASPDWGDFPVKVGSRWRHIKRGYEYRVSSLRTLQCARKEEPGPQDGDVLVCYDALDPDCPARYRHWARPLSEFLDGRFEPMGFNSALTA